MMRILYQEKVMFRHGLLLLSLFFTSYTMADNAKYKAVMGEYSARKVDKIIQTQVLPNAKANQGDLISAVSSAFLQTPYQADPLIGSQRKP